MKLYAYVKKGLLHKEGVCEDTVLAGTTLLKGGYLEMELPERFLVGVADGVGGEEAGEIASGLTMLRLAELDAGKLTKENLRIKLEEINEEILAVGKDHWEFQRMSSTLMLCGIVGDGTFYASVGNSRLYRCVMRNGIRQLSKESEDHTLLNDLIRFGEPEELCVEDIINTPRAKMLTSHVGMHKEMFSRKLEMGEMEFSNTVRYILTSDGIHDHIGYEDLKQFVCQEKMSCQLLENIIQKAIDAGSKDDLSIVVIE